MTRLALARKHGWQFALALLSTLGIGTPSWAVDVAPDHAAKMARGLEIFKKEVRVLLKDRCVKCHAGADRQGNLDLSTRDGLLKGGEHGPAVVIGRGDKSLLTRLLRHEQEPFMPEEGKPLTREEIARIVAWIDLGAPYDGSLSGDTVIAGPSWTERKIDPKLREFWSFQPLRRVTPPALVPGETAATPIDAFLRASQRTAGLTPNPPVERGALIRRLYFDLLGLPPTPSQLAAALHDPSPNWYERLVDELLASPHYGERWARHWLDLARFAESHGFEHDYDRPTAFHYRDFVIQALNEGLPFDRFLQWQIAGDEFAPDDRLAQMATGFLAAGVHSTQITANEAERHRYDEMDDMLATIGTTFLGLTVGCARCHDHKFDPLPQADYYRLLSTFTTTIRSEVDLDFDPVGYARDREKFDAEHAPFAAAVAAYERDLLPGKFTAWRSANATSLARSAWVLPRMVGVTSQAGAEFSAQPDGSWVAGGKNGNHDVYTVTLNSNLARITAIRIEALSHPSLVHGGPGRAGNGNFALSTVSLDVKADENQARLKFGTPQATFEQNGLPIAASLDDNPASAWAVDPQFGRDHAAIFPLAEPLVPTGPTELKLTLTFQCNTQHNIGRLRVSLADGDAQPVVSDVPFRESILSLLTKNEAEWTDDERQELLSWFKPQDAGWKELDDRRAQHAATAPKPRIQKVLIASEGLAPVKLHTQAEKEYLAETHFLRRGDPQLKEGVATPAFLQILSGDAARWATLPPPGARTSFQRTALAKWLTDAEYGAGALVARVQVNRLWQHLLGRGLVATPSDFGARGELPSQPLLLDWLAGELIRTGWDGKTIQRLIVLSDVYRQTSRESADQAQRDPENRHWARRPQQRLQAEAIRDAMLFVCGLLDDRLYGPGTLDEQHRRRSIYFTVKRSQLIPMMSVFDAPDGTTSIGDRPQTTIAPQALILLNGPQARLAARSLAEQFATSVATDELPKQIELAYRTLLQRPATAEEIADGANFLQAQAAGYRPQQPATGLLAAWTDFLQVLFCLNEFVYVD